jgi:hypothetical protein
VKVLRVKNWDELQHYADRNPVWIKLYLRLLDDYDFSKFTDAEVGQLVKLWLFAARSKGEIPHDPGFIASRVPTSEPIALSRFIETGFLVLAQPNDCASATESVSEGNAQGAASLEKIREEKKREEEKREEEAGGGGTFDAWLSRVPESYRDAVLGALRAAQNPDALRREFLGLEHPITGGPSYGPEVVGQAVHEMAVGGSRMGAKTLRAFCRRVGEEPPEAGAAGRGGRPTPVDPWSPENIAKIGEAA